MNNILHFEHRTRLSWNRDFFQLDDQTGNIKSIQLNLLQRILRITLGSLASLIGLNAFYASTILSQKRITPFEQTRNAQVAINIQILVCALEGFGKILSYNEPDINPLNPPPELKNSEDGQVQEQAEAQPIVDLWHFFPNAGQPIPKDVASLVLRWLDLKDVVRMKQVNKSWNQLICNISNSLKRKFIESCYEEATKAIENIPLVGGDHGDIFRGFKGILKSLVKYDIEATKRTVIVAKQMASKLERHSKDYLLREIAQVEAHYDIEAAKQTIETIRDELWRNQVIFYITLYIEKNFPKAKALVLAQGLGIVGNYQLKDIVCVEAETDIASALETLPSIQDLDVRAQAKVEIIKRQAKKDLPAAQVLTASLDNPRFRYQAELALAQLDPKPNFQPAIETALTIVNGEDNEQERALAQIAIIQNKFDEIEAQKTLELIPVNSFQRYWPTCAIAESKAKANMKTAMQFLINMSEQHNYRLQLIFLEHVARKNMWEAKTLAHSFDDLEKRIIALTDLAEFAIKGDKTKQAYPLSLQRAEAPE